MNVGTTSVSCQDKEFSAYEEVACQEICTKTRTSTLDTGQEMEQIKTEQNVSKGHVIQRKHITFKNVRIVTASVKSFSCKAQKGALSLEMNQS